MAGLSTYKPTSDGRRGMTKQDTSMLTTGEKLRKLTSGRKRAVGRNSAGRITTRHKGAGAKRLYRQIDWKRAGEREATVIAIAYDPNRTARIAHVRYEDGEDAYILAPNNIEVGQKLLQGDNVALKDGNCTLLDRIPNGLIVHGVELQPGKGAQLVRSAGSYATVSGKEGAYVYLKMNSGELKKVLGTCRATIGQLSNTLHSTITIGKAGRQRHLGRRPTVRGKAMNRADHPHGGGEGLAPIGLRKGPKTKWGALALGVKTRRKSKPKLNYLTKR